MEHHLPYVIAHRNASQEVYTDVTELLHEIKPHTVSYWLLNTCQHRAAIQQRQKTHRRTDDLPWQYHARHYYIYAHHTAKMVVKEKNNAKVLPES